MKRPNTSPQSSIRPWTLRSRPCLERQSRLRSTGFVGSLRLGLVLESLVHIAAVPHKELSGKVLVSLPFVRSLYEVCSYDNPATPCCLRPQ